MVASCASKLISIETKDLKIALLHVRPFLLALDLNRVYDEPGYLSRFACVLKRSKYEQKKVTKQELSDKHTLIHHFSFV